MPLGKISRMIEMLPASLQADIDTLVHSAEFRGLDSLEEQISYLRDNSDISFEMLHILLDMKKSTLYRYYKRYSGENRENPSKQPSPQRYGPNSVLTMDQEMQVIIIIIIMLGCITCCALHACLRCAQVLLALHASPLRPADLLRLCSARFF